MPIAISEPKASFAPSASIAKIAPPLAPADVDRLADEIAEVASHIDAAEHRLLTLIRHFDEGSGWAAHGALSCAHWLNWRIGLDLGAARERVRVARALDALPLVDDALRRGAISYSKVRAVTRVATASTEATLLEMAAHATASQLERICRGYRRVLADAQADRSESLAEEEQRRFVRVRDTDDGMVRIEARLRPEEAAVVLQALDVARRRAWWSDAERSTQPPAAARHDGAPDVSAETPPEPRRRRSHDRNRRHHPQQHEPPPTLSRADALLAVAESYLSSAASADVTHGTAAAPIELVVHVDHATLRADPHAHNGAAHAGTDTRADHDQTHDPTAAHAHPRQRHAARRRDRAAPRVRRDRRARHRRARRARRSEPPVTPHAPHRTAPAPRAAPARRRLPLPGLHEPALRRAPRARLGARWRDAAREPVLALPPPPSPGARARLPHRSPSDPLAALRDANAARGLLISPTTAFPRWDGEPVDYGLAVQALLVRGASDDARATCEARCPASASR